MIKDEVIHEGVFDASQVIQNARCIMFCEEDGGKVKGVDVRWEVWGSVPEVDELRERGALQNWTDAEGVQEVEACVIIKGARDERAFYQRFSVFRD